MAARASANLGYLLDPNRASGEEPRDAACSRDRASPLPMSLYTAEATGAKISPNKFGELQTRIISANVTRLAGDMNQKIHDSRGVGLSSAAPPYRLRSSVSHPVGQDDCGNSSDKDAGSRPASRLSLPNQIDRRLSDRLSERRAYDSVTHSFLGSRATSAVRRPRRRPGRA